MSPFNKDASCVIYLRSRYASGDGAVIKHCQGRSKTASQPSLSCLLLKADYLFIFHGRRVELSWRSEQVPSWSLHSVACDQSHSSDNNQRLTLDSLGCQWKLRYQPCLIICFKLGMAQLAVPRVFGSVDVGRLFVFNSACPHWTRSICLACIFCHNIVYQAS